jgi:hypothetical protein
MFILSVILILILLYTYYYLVELSQCPCFVANQHDKLYLDYMKFYLLLDLFTIVIALFITKKINHMDHILVIFSVLLVIFMHGYMTYNVYYFYKSIKSYCDCANQWQKYFIYYEGIVAGLVTLQYLISFLLIFILLHNRS